MGIIARQASKNLIFIVLGFLAGAVNTLIVLPNAFENDPENWGLLRSLVAWFMILSQLFSFGSTNVIIRYFARYEERPGPLLQFGLLVAGLGITLLAVLVFGFGESLIALSNGEHIHLLSDHLGLLFLLAANFVVFLTFQGFVNAIFKSVFHQFLNETFLKSYYLAICAAYWLGWLNFEQLLFALAVGYILASAALVVYSKRFGFNLKGSLKRLDEKREKITYGLYSILDRGAQTIVNNLDVIMIGLIIGLDDVGLFTLAAYVGTVTQMPQRAIQVIANPIVSKAIETRDYDDLRNVYLESALNQLILGGAIFLGIWVSIDELMSLMPGQYGNGKWVVFLIGLSKLFYTASGVSGAMIVYSQFFRTNLHLNLALIVLTIISNYVLISPDYFNWGIEGAALATAITYFIYNAAKLIFVKGKFGLNPLTGKTLIVTALLALIATGFHMWSPAWNAFIAIAVKSAVSMAIFGAIIYITKLSPELNKLVANALKKR